MKSQLFTTVWSLYFTCITWLHSTVPGRIFTQGIQRSVLVSRRSQSKKQKNNSSFDKEFPLVWHFPDQLLVCLPDNRDPGWKMASTMTTSGEHLPLCTSRSVWQWEGKQCGAMLSHGKWSWANAPQFPPVVWQKQMGGCGMGKLGNDVESQGLGWFYPVSKLCGLPAHLPRNLASFSPSVDDGNRGGSWPRWLGDHWRFLTYHRGGVRVLIVHSRGQGSYWRACGREYSFSKEL